MKKNLFDELEPAILNACLKSQEKHDGEHFYSVVLYTSASYGYFVDSIATLEGLERAARDYLAKESFKNQWQSMSVALKELKWSPSDLPYHCEFENEFGRVNQVLQEVWHGIPDDSMEQFLATCEAIHATAIAALRSVMNSGIFDSQQVVFNLGMLGLSDEELFFFAEQINSEELLRNLRAELSIDEEALRQLRLDR